MPARSRGAYPTCAQLPVRDPRKKRLKFVGAMSKSGPNRKNRKVKSKGRLWTTETRNSVKCCLKPARLFLKPDLQEEPFWASKPKGNQTRGVFDIVASKWDHTQMGVCQNVIKIVTKGFTG